MNAPSLLSAFILAGSPAAFSAPAAYNPNPGLNPASASDRATILNIWNQLNQQLWTNQQVYNNYTAIINGMSSGSLVSFAAQQLAQVGASQPAVYEAAIALAAFESVGTWGPALLTQLEAILVTTVQNQITGFQTAYGAVITAGH